MLGRFPAGHLPEAMGPNIGRPKLASSSATDVTMVCKPPVLAPLSLGKASLMFGKNWKARKSATRSADAGRIRR